MINVAALEEIYLNIDKAKAAQKRNDQPKIIAVTKTHPFSAIEDVYNCGIFSIGENRVQEASNKFQSFNKMPDLTKRFIGHLQSNKVKKCMELFDTIDTVDSLKLIRKISKQASEIKISDVFIAVDEKIKTVGCEKHSENGCNGKSSKCITHDLWDELEDYINNFFQQKTLSDLVRRGNLNG